MAYMNPIEYAYRCYRPAVRIKIGYVIIYAQDLVGLFQKERAIHAFPMQYENPVI
jgi:hypothetical protein